MESIIQTNKECWKCKTTLGLHSHHCFEGRNRQNSEKYGLKVWLCGKHHNLSDEGVHFNKEFDLELKQLAQTKFCEYYNKTDEDFIKIFRRNYK